MVMLAQKRKRTRSPDTDHSSELSETFTDNEVDISSALTGKGARVAPTVEESDNDDLDLQHFLKESISRRDIKAGTEIVKKTKGKGKFVKGEVGGGSFQSMGQAIVF